MTAPVDMLILLESNIWNMCIVDNVLTNWQILFWVHHSINDTNFDFEL